MIPASSGGVGRRKRQTGLMQCFKANPHPSRTPCPTEHGIPFGQVAKEGETILRFLSVGITALTALPGVMEDTLLFQSSQSPPATWGKVRELGGAQGLRNGSGTETCSLSNPSTPISPLQRTARDLNKFLSSKHSCFLSVQPNPSQSPIILDPAHKHATGVC